MKTNIHFLKQVLRSTKNPINQQESCSLDHQVWRPATSRPHHLKCLRAALISNWVKHFIFIDGQPRHSKPCIQGVRRARSAGVCHFTPEASIKTLRAPNPGKDTSQFRSRPDKGSWVSVQCDAAQDPEVSAPVPACCWVLPFAFCKRFTDLSAPGCCSVPSALHSEFVRGTAVMLTV